jgi:hypothetical protein
MDMKRIGTTMVFLVIASSVFGTWFSTVASATMRTSHPASTPRGWKSYTYREARISVPSNWAVEHNEGCPVLSAPGTLQLGPAKGPSSCLPGIRDTNIVSLSPLSASDYYALTCPKIEVNGLAIVVGPCTSSNTAGIVIYAIPALGVQAVGSGVGSENVTGPGTSTIVGLVLHTLRR